MLKNAKTFAKLLAINVIYTTADIMSIVFTILSHFLKIPYFNNANYIRNWTLYFFQKCFNFISYVYFEI